MNILHLAATPYHSGPAETVTLLAQAQRALGHTVWVAVDRKRTLAPAEELWAPRLQAADLLSEAGLELSVKSSPVAVWRDLRALHRLDVEVVHCHLSHDHFLARLGRPRGARLIRSLHAERSLRRRLPHADGWTVPVAGWREHLPGQQVEVLPALVDGSFVRPADRRAVRASLGLPAEGLLVGMVSTFQASRRHALAVRAFAGLPWPRHLALVGDGQLEGEVRRQVAEAGLTEQVTFAGYRSGPEFLPWLQALDVLWVLGLGNDFAGRTAAQGRACGVTVVTVDEGALGTWADQVVEATPRALAEGTLEALRRGPRPPLASETAGAVAERILGLYRGKR